jgi:3-deoxy-D-manno-octulosonate 8-phosphate phosphatase (KDO 8-P phosphatase)
MALKEKLKKIKVLAMDVDGVLTEGGIVIDSDGREIKVFNVLDGFGIVVAQRAGLKTAIITARWSRPVSFRAKDLKINKVYQDAFPKTEAYEKMLKEFGVKDNEVCFVGDDLPDLHIFKRVGFAATVPGAAAGMKRFADYITKTPGGKGAVREVIELILTAQGKWRKILKNFGA